MFSPRKKMDKEMMLEIAETIEVLVSVGTTQAIDLAEDLGDKYLYYKNKVEKHDYTHDDKLLEEIDKLI